MSPAVVIGGGLAGCEAAWQLATRGFATVLFEMRPAVKTPAHQTDLLAELVCSNSLKSDADDTAGGLLKKELRALGSLILSVAQQTAVPAGSALAVDRHRFAARITEIVSSHPLIQCIRQEVTELPVNVPLVVASGPLTSPALSRSIGRLLGQENLYFYDAIAPLVAAESLNRHQIFIGSRYGKGSPAYLNCPLDRPQYETFYQRLLEAETIPLRPFEEGLFFQRCMPIEEMARRGDRTLLFGPMRAVGLLDPRTGRRPYAVVQLRQDNAQATIYNMVGFQTRLRHVHQQEVFRLIPGLERAEFLRYGSVHRNSYICAPRVLEATLQVRGHSRIFLGGQITGGEGYVEAVATGLLAGLNLSRILGGHRPALPPATSMIGALCRYIAGADADSFQPMNTHFGLLPPPDHPCRNRPRRNRQLIQRALQDLADWIRVERIDRRDHHRASGEEVPCFSGPGEELL